jgi:hypothetical protein
VFQVLSRAELFRQLASLALFLPQARRRLFAVYASKTLVPKLNQAREDALHEEYAVIPATGEGGRESWQRELRLPAEEIVRMLTERDGSSAHVLIESPGGRGKSALVREVARLLLESFLADPGNPLPIYCDGQAVEFKQVTDINRMVALALGDYQPLPDQLAEQIRSGLFVLIVDGLTESNLSAGLIREYVAGNKASRLLATSRPDAGYHQAFRTADHWAIVEPKPLDGSTLKAFVSKYGRAGLPAASFPRELLAAFWLDEGALNALVAEHAGPTVSGTSLSPELLEACRSADGQSYLQILVRLALGLPDASARSLSDLYERTLERLLRNPAKTVTVDQIKADTRRLCLETYWETGERRLLFADAKEGNKKTLGVLKDAGIVVADGTPVVSTREPQRVRFFHDSVQSYMTAKALAVKYDGQAEKLRLTLRRAAANPLFTNTRPGSDARSELFSMCCHTFGEPAAVARLVADDLKDCATRFADFLVPDDVRTAARIADGAGLNPGTARDATSNRSVDQPAAVSHVMALADTLNHPDKLDRLERVYLLIAQNLGANRKISHDVYEARIDSGTTP